MPDINEMILQKSGEAVNTVECSEIFGILRMSYRCSFFNVIAYLTPNFTQLIDSANFYSYF